MCVLTTLFIVLTERKLLAFAQRRMGPTLMGRNGAFQILADLFKMLTKEIFIIFSFEISSIISLKADSLKLSISETITFSVLFILDIFWYLIK